MAPLAQAFVRLRADSSLLGAEVTRDATVAGEKAGLAMGRSMSSGMSRTFKAAAGLGAATGLVEAGRQVLEMADKFELSRTRVEQTTENIGANVKDVTGQVGALDTKMDALGFTMSDTEGAFATLEAATRNPAKAMRDTALAADIARGRNISLSEATSILARVETGHVSQLGRLGIALKDSAGHTLSAADALQQLTDLYGGSAARYADTFAGKQQVLKAEFQDSATKIGVDLLPALVDLAHVVQHDVVPPIEDAAHLFDSTRHVLEPLVKTGLELTAMWKAYTFIAGKAASVTATVGERAAATAVALKAEDAAGRTALGSFTALSRVGKAGVLGGAAALTAGSFVPGTAGTILSGAGAGALIGSAIGPEGTAAGAVLGAGAAAVAPIITGTPQGKKDFVKLAESSTAGFAQVQEIADKTGKALSEAAIRGGGVVKMQHDWAEAAIKAARAQNLEKAAAEGVTDAARAQANTLVAVNSATLGLQSSQDGLRSAMQQAATTAANGGRALKGNSDAAIANRDALRGEVGAMSQIIAAMQAQGATTDAIQAATYGLTTAIETNAVKTYGNRDAVDKLLHSLGLVPGAVAAVARAIASMPALSSALASDTVSKGALTQLGLADKQAAAQTKAGEKVAQAFVGGYTPIVAKATNDAAKKAATAAADAFNALKDRATADLQTISDAVKSTQSSVAGFADFSATGTDALGASGLNTDVAGQLKAKAAKLQQFASLFNRLDHAGLDPHLLAQFAQIGPEAIPAMQALTAGGRRAIGQVNRIEGSIQRSATSVATTDATAQNTALIHKDLTTLPTKLERSFERGLSKLNIVTDRRGNDRAAGIAVVISP